MATKQAGRQSGRCRAIAGRRGETGIDGRGRVVKRGACFDEFRSFEVPPKASAQKPKSFPFNSRSRLRARIPRWLYFEVQLLLYPEVVAAMYIVVVEPIVVRTCDPAENIM